MLRSDLRDYSNVYIVVKGRITVEWDNNNNNNNNKTRIKN